MCVWVQDLNPGFHLYLLLLAVTPSAVATYVRYKQREMTHGKRAASNNTLKVFLMHSAFLSFVHVHVLCTSGLWISMYVRTSVTLHLKILTVHKCTLFNVYGVALYTMPSC